MKVQFTVNNYQLGAKVKSTPTNKLISSERTDRYHTTIVYDDINERELQFIQKVLAKRGIVL